MGTNNMELGHPNANQLMLSEKEKSELMNTLERTIKRNYLNSLDLLPVLPYKEDLCPVRFYQISQVIKQDGVFQPDKLAMCYRALSYSAGTLVMVVMKTAPDDVRVYMGTRDPSGNNYDSAEVLEDSLKGFLPGVKIEMTGQIDLLEGMKTQRPALSCFSGIASFVDDRKQQCIQGLENLLNATVGIPAFTAVLLAEHVTPSQLDVMKNAYLNIHQQLSPLEQLQISDSVSFGKSISIGLSQGFMKSISESLAKTTSHGSSSSSGAAYNVSAGIQLPGFQVSNGISIHAEKGTYDGHAQTDTHTEQNAENSALNINNGEQMNTGKATTFIVKNRFISDILKTVDDNINRYTKARPHGSWSVATYFMCNDNTTARKLAGIYAGSITGNRSEIQGAGCSLWKLGSPQSDTLLKYLGAYRHPEFSLNDYITVDAGTLVDSNELSIHLPLPQTSVQGVTVKNEACFGLTVVTNHPPKENSSICLGQIQHLGEIYPEKVCLDISRFTQHVLVTGTCGSGKSNAVYHLLDNLHEHGVRFMVIEPAKGEYLHVFGKHPHIPDVKVYGTNPRITRQLAFNPFSFPEEVLLNEHINGLCNVLYACWPLYAAMPQLLKQAIEAAYRNCGWDVDRSTNPYGIWPTFGDVISALKDIVDNSAYSTDSKSDYKGALQSRLESMCGGLIGQVFNTPAIADEDLFNANVIIDLSRMQSDDTKALLMGLLVMKLDEFRKSENKGFNRPLHHVAVIEEAHHLLKRTSTVQMSESANLAGMAVTSIGTCMREMRTYGQGFIIVDQSPALLDEVTVSNTNTRIVLSMPARNDIDTMSRALNLNEAQAGEVSRLDTGEALVHQQGWAETVRCKVHHYDTSVCVPWTYHPAENMGYAVKESCESTQRVLDAMYRHYTGTASKEPLHGLVQDILRMELSGSKRYAMIQITVGKDTLTSDECAEMLAVMAGTELYEKAMYKNDVAQMNRSILHGLSQLPEVARFGHASTMLDMYMRGCSNLNASPFYEKWQLLNLK